MEDGLVLFTIMETTILSASLNPYCSGRWSRTFNSLSNFEKLSAVLILIVVEDGLVPVKHSAMSAVQLVLILIVVEDGLVHKAVKDNKKVVMKGLNPYCSGRWSRTVIAYSFASYGVWS